MGKLDGKVAVVTGGTKGIGRAICELFVKEGAVVFACSRHLNDFDVKKAKYLSIDITDEKSCQDGIDSIVKEYGKIDILVNNAGIMKDRTLAKMSDEEFDSVLQTNVKGTFNMTRIVGPMMMKNGQGTIVNISSFVARDGNVGQTNYVASKAAIEGMSKCWAKEFSRHGENVRVNCLAPGVILTDIFSNTSKEILDGFAEKTMLKRLAQPEEIAKAVLFLASDDSSYVTGTTLYVDGGIRL